MSGLRMERLSFVLPDFTRTIWVNDKAREVWGPRLQAVTRAWLELEWRAIVAGVRACAIAVVSPDRLVEQTAEWLRHGLTALPIQMQGTGGSYSSTPIAAEAGRPFVYRAVVGRTDDVQTFLAAFQASDEVTIGRLLGYPPCCTTFFRRVWVDDRMVDTTWPMAAATTEPASGARQVTVSGAPEANILWRWMGARAVPHLPCRFDCDATVALGRRFMAVGRETHPQEMAWLGEILRWPVEWSALHGVAEIRTPILKVSSRTDATPVKYTVQREGDAYPVEGAQGLRFPYRTPPRPLMTKSMSFRRGMDHEIVTVDPLRRWQALDNGFATVAGMTEAHEPVIAFTAETLGADGGAVLDLGCGNGALLRSLSERRPGVVPFGIDIDAERVARARAAWPERADGFWAGNLFDTDAPWAGDRRYAAALLMPGRLLEVDAERTVQLRHWLRDRCERIVVYAYGDWLTKYDSLSGLVTAAGLRPVTIGEKVGLAEIVDE